jgi:hypothetical protein
MVITMFCICLQVKSMRLLPSEKVQLTKNAVFLVWTSFGICINMVADYCLYWLLSIVRRYAGVRTTVEG